MLVLDIGTINTAKGSVSKWCSGKTRNRREFSLNVARTSNSHISRHRFHLCSEMEAAILVVICSFVRSS